MNLNSCCTANILCIQDSGELGHYLMIKSLVRHACNLSPKLNNYVWFVTGECHFGRAHSLNTHNISSVSTFFPCRHTPTLQGPGIVVQHYPAFLIPLQNFREMLEYKKLKHEGTYVCSLFVVDFLIA